MKKSLVTVKVRSRSNWMMMRQFSMGSWDGKVCIVVGRCVEGKKEAWCLLNSLYNNIPLLLRPLRLSSDSHFRTFTVLGWENGSIFGLLDVRSNVAFLRAIGRKIIHLMLSCFRDVFVLILPPLPSSLLLCPCPLLCTLGSSALLHLSLLMRRDKHLLSFEVS